MSDRADCRAKEVIRIKEGQHIMIKESVQQGDITILKVHMPRKRISNYMRQKHNHMETQVNPPLQLEPPTPLPQKRTDATSRESVQTQLNSTPSVNWM